MLRVNTFVSLDSAHFPHNTEMDYSISTCVFVSGRSFKQSKYTSGCLKQHSGLKLKFWGQEPLLELAPMLVPTALIKGRLHVGFAPTMLTFNKMVQTMICSNTINQRDVKCYIL